MLERTHPVPPISQFSSLFSNGAISVCDPGAGLSLRPRNIPIGVFIE
jgi:hypothetical protein